MLRPYNIDYTDKATNGSFQIQPGQVDSTTTSLTLPGKGRVDYGEAYDTNLVHLLENFANATAPANPINGQLWYDTNAQHTTLRVYNKSTGVWLELLAVSSVDRFHIPSVAVLPTTNLLPGDLAMLSVDNKLYLYDGAAWRALATEIWAQNQMVIDGGATTW